MELNDLLSNITRGDFLKPYDILPFLCSETKEERCQVNFKLAKAYLEAQNIHQAKTFIRRAWVLSEFSPDVLPLYVKIHAQLNDIESIQSAYRTLGMKEAAAKNIAEAINYFMLSMYAHAHYRNIDHYEYDFEMLECIQKLAEPHQFDPGRFLPISSTRKVRLAYLMFGMTHLNSVIVKINRLLAQFHDKTRFEVAFFVPDDEKRINRSDEAKENIRILREHGCRVVIPKSNGDQERLFEVGTEIFNYKPDVLITSALLADLKHYFITSLRPAPVVVGFVQGPPPQFASPSLDWSISWTKHPLIDCPCNCSLVDLEIGLPDVATVSFFDKRHFNLPDDSLVLMSVGRYPKFQDLAFWEAILGILRTYPNLYYVSVGIKRQDVPFLEKVVTPEEGNRLRLLGWREDCLEVLGLADIMIDTFPSGGGVILMDAMALGIPVVSFQNDYMRVFDQNDWSPGEEIVSIPDLIVERGNFEQLKILLTELIKNQEYRSRMGKRCKEQVRSTNGSPERMVRTCENIYLKVLKARLQEKNIPISDEINRTVYNEIGDFESFGLRVRSWLSKLLFAIRRFFKVAKN